MLANATRICEAEFGTLFRFDGKVFHLGRLECGAPQALLNFRRSVARTRRIRRSDVSWRQKSWFRVRTTWPNRIISMFHRQFPCCC